MEIERERQAKMHMTVLREQERLKYEERQAVENVERRASLKKIRKNDYSYSADKRKERVDTAPSNLEQRKSPRLERSRDTINDPPIVSKAW